MREKRRKGEKKKSGARGHYFRYLKCNKQVVVVSVSGASKDDLLKCGGKLFLLGRAGLAGSRQWREGGRWGSSKRGKSSAFLIS